MENPFLNKKRSWYNAEPLQKEVTTTVTVCPWCETKLDAIAACNDRDRCKCGSWSIGFSRRWMFQRNENEEEKKEYRKNRITELEIELESLKRAYGET